MKMGATEEMTMEQKFERRLRRVEVNTHTALRYMRVIAETHELSHQIREIEDEFATLLANNDLDALEPV
jgi:hypothetical protein